MDEYKPFGDMWEKEIMSLPKKQIIKMFRKVAEEREYYRKALRKAELREWDRE